MIGIFGPVISHPAPFPSVENTPQTGKAKTEAEPEQMKRRKAVDEDGYVPVQIKSCFVMFVEFWTQFVHSVPRLCFNHPIS